MLEPAFDPNTFATACLATLGAGSVTVPQWIAGWYWHPSHVEISYIAPINATYTTYSPAMTPTMSAPPKYRWQDRLQQLRDWRGDKGEAERLSETAITIAADMAAYAEQRFAARDVEVTTVLSGLGTGGVQAEWTVRTALPYYHLEIELPRDSEQPVVLLRTRELADGQILQAHEVRNASMAEAMAELEKLARHAERAAAATRPGTATAVG